jgi:uncharacterized protein
MPTKKVALTNAARFFVYILLVWGLYRFLIKLPEDIEELIIKPIVWLVPLFSILRKEKATLASIGITLQNLFPAIYLSLILGAVFAIEGIFINMLKYQWIHFAANIGNNAFFYAMVISLATAISEELVFRGYIYTRLEKAFGGHWYPNIMSSFLWALVQVPISILWWKFDPMTTVVYLLLAFIFGIGASFIFARTKNIVAPILLHFLWSWPIILFR